MMRDNKPEGFFYLDHRTVDSKNNIIVDVHVTPGNVSDTDPILKRLDRITSAFDFPKKTKYIGLDAGYSTNPIFKGLVDRDLVPVVAYRRSPHKKECLLKISSYMILIKIFIFDLIILLLFIKIQLVKVIKNIDVLKKYALIVH